MRFAAWPTATVYKRKLAKPAAAAQIMVDNLLKFSCVCARLERSRADKKALVTAADELPDFSSLAIRQRRAERHRLR
jgi:hypothetical protein